MCKKFRIIKSANHDIVSDLINELLDDGWDFYGELHIRDGDSWSVYTQAMVLKEDLDDMGLEE